MFMLIGICLIQLGFDHLTKVEVSNHIERMWHTIFEPQISRSTKCNIGKYRLLYKQGAHP